MTRFCTFLILCSLFISATNAIFRQEPYGPEKWIKRYLSQPKEKVAKIHFYLQDNNAGPNAGPNATVWEVARSKITSNSSTGFGQIVVLDNVMTARPDRNSEIVGRYQGLATSADLHVLSLAINANIVFTSGPYNGSTLSILGRNAVTTTNRELSIVGGTGIFRMARGFAITSTYSNDVVRNYIVLEYTLYVFYV